MILRGQVGGQRGDLIVVEIGNDALGQDQDMTRARVQPRQHIAPRRILAQVAGDALQTANRRFIGQRVVLVGDHRFEIDLDPHETGGQVETIGPRIEPGAEIDDHVDAILNGVADEAVQTMGAQRDRPRHRARYAHMPRDPAAAFTGQLFGQRIVKQRVAPPPFLRAMPRDPEGGVGNMFDEIRHERKPVC